VIADERVREFFQHSVSAAKWKVVARDIHVREVMDQVSRLECDLTALNRYAVLTIKACGILARKGSSVVKWLRANDFDIVDGWITHLTPERSRIVWRWQLEKASRHRLWVMDNILSTTDTVVLILRRDRDADIPAAAWLSVNKGPANRDRQRPGQMRFELEPTCFLLNYVHTSDDAVDIFRDIYVLGGMRRVAALCETIGSSSSAQLRNGAQRIVNATETRAPFHDLSFDTCVNGLIRHIPVTGSDHDLDFIDRMITDELSGRTIESSKLVQYSPIDVAVYVAHRFEMSIPQIRDPFQSGSGTS
jgi:hypothetical protein